MLSKLFYVGAALLVLLTVLALLGAIHMAWVPLAIAAAICVAAGLVLEGRAP